MIFIKMIFVGHLYRGLAVGLRREFLSSSRVYSGVKRFSENELSKDSISILYVIDGC